VALHVVAVVVVVVVTVAAFLPTFQNEFVAWDDDFNLYKNAAYRGLGPQQLYWMLTSSHHGHYHPLTWLTFGLDYVIWGMNPVGYHLTGLVLHALGAVACYALALSLLRLAIGQAVSGPALWMGAVFSALMFAIHPLRVESVAWATERRDVLSGIFYFLGVWAYLHGHSRGAERRRRWLAVCFACYVLALFSKVITVSLPAVLLVLDVYPLRRVRGGEGWAGRAVGLVVEKLPLFGAGVGVSILAVAVQPVVLRVQDGGAGLAVAALRTPEHAPPEQPAIPVAGDLRRPGDRRAHPAAATLAGAVGGMDGPRTDDRAGVRTVPERPADHGRPIQLPVVRAVRAGDRRGGGVDLRERPVTRGPGGSCRGHDCVSDRARLADLAADRLLA
jgi:hypothetical protein